MKYLIYFISYVVSFSAQAHGVVSPTCPLILDQTSVSGSSTETFIGYLGTLLERQIIGGKELSRLIANLEKGVLINPINKEDAQISSTLQIHRDGLEEYIRSGQIDSKNLLVWARKTLKEKDSVRERREEAKSETQEIHRQMVFNRVEPGDYYRSKKVHVRIQNPFEMMSTAVTQKQWSIVMGENPSKFVDGVDSIVITINGKQIKMQPDNPVEQVSWDAVKKYIAKIYTLSEKDDPKLYQLIPDHKKGDRYRLPDEDEWEYVITNRGRSYTDFHFGDNEADLKDHAWYLANSDRMTHPVAQLPPLVVDGKEFYDMHGNVWEWMRNHSMAVEFPNRALRGGGAADSPGALYSIHSSQAEPDRRYPYIGFRLVRIRP